MEINTAIAGRAREGALLSEAELLELDGADVLSLGMLADEVRRARVGDTVSYARVLVVGAEGLVAGEQVDAALAHADEVRLAAPGATLEDTADLVSRVRARVGGTRRLVGFSLGDLAAREWGSLRDVIAALHTEGLEGLSDAAVDVLPIEAIEMAVAGGLPPATLSVQRQPQADRVSLLARVREILARVPSIRSVSPLSREQSVTVPTTGYHDVRMVALARLALPMVPTIAVDWEQYGPKLAQVALMFGANHLDRVSPVDDPALGPRRATAEEVRRNIAAAGLTPAEPGEAA